jgi:hypothetical protein
MTCRAPKLLLAALAVTAIPACEELRAQTRARGVDALQTVDPAADEEGKSDCMTCRKWSAKPPSGVNGPPVW